jgi:hypothetical protein
MIRPWPYVLRQLKGRAPGANGKRAARDDDLTVCG